MKFIKMHGLGNDYIYIDCFQEKTPEDPSALSKFLSRRHHSIGSDGLILIEPSHRADAAMRVFNADGSEAEMCGNGIRCVGKYLYDSGISRRKKIHIETKYGVRQLQMIVRDGIATGARVDMGRPTTIEEGRKIRVLDEEVEVTGIGFGNPHAVLFVPEWPEDEKFFRLGAALERHPLFPHRANIEFVHVVSPEELHVRVWERGSGETLACGSGACASLCAAVLNDLSAAHARVVLKGGPLDIEWNRTNRHVYMQGPAEISFVGEVHLKTEEGVLCLAHGWF